MRAMRKIVLIPGTRDWAPPEDGKNVRWWQSNSPFTLLWQRSGFQRHGWTWHGLDLPQWATGLAGTAWADKDHRTWWRGAYGQAEALERLPLEDRNVICHSHGGNLGVLLAGMVPLHRLITVCTPVRRDMRDAYDAVTCPWMHVYDANLWTNRMQLFGARLSFEMKMPGAKNLKLKGIGHSELVRNPLRFEAIHTQELMPFVALERARHRGHGDDDHRDRL